MKHFLKVTGGSGNNELDGIEKKRGLGREKGKDGPGPVIVSDTLCPAVHILGT